MGAKNSGEGAIQVALMARESISVCIIGMTPLILEAMSSKVRQDLLFPPQKQNRAAKASNLKHVPLDEFRRSAYRAQPHENTQSRILFPAAAFGGAISGVATDLPGVAKAQMKRLAYVQGPISGFYIELFGVPRMLMSVVRCADPARTPDIRTRAILPEWACRLTIEYTKPLLNQQIVCNLLANAGIMRGVGGWRPERGGTFGQFAPTEPDNPEFLQILSEGGRDAQDAAFASPEFFDSETAELSLWFDEELLRRGMAPTEKTVQRKAA